MADVLPLKFSAGQIARFLSGTDTLALAIGGTGANLSATGGAAQYLKQTSVGAVVTVGTIPASDIASGAALTKTDDTNVTLSLGGTPTSALLVATSLTLGWTGTLADSRLSTTAVTAAGYGSATQVGTFTVSATGRLTAASNVTITPAASSITGGAALTKTDDTNVTLTLGGTPTTALLVAASLTLGWTGTLSLARGGTAAALTASNGGIVYSTASALAILAGTATAGLVLVSGASTTPSWFTPTAGSVLFAGTGGILQQDNSKLFWDDTNFRLGVGTNSPIDVLHIVSPTNTILQEYLDTYSSSASHRHVLNFRKASGTFASPTTVGNSDDVGSLYFHAHNGTSFIVMARIQFLSGGGSGTVSSSSMPSTMRILTTKDGTNSLSTRITIGYDGNVGIGTLTTPTAFFTITQTISTTGSPTGFLLTGAAHTTLANAETIDVNFNLARTVQFTGNTLLATQRAVLIQAPTYSSDTATKTITTAATLAITGAPVAGTNVTLTNKYALWVQAGITELDGAVVIGGAVTLQNLDGNSIPYMTNASVMSDIISVATGSVLISQGTTTQPIWSASPSLTSLVLSSFLNEAKGADIASATTTDIGAATGNYLDVTGTTTITGLGTIQAGTRRIVRFTGALTLTHNATSLIIPGAANRTTVDGDVAEFVSLGSGNWRCITYVPTTVTGTGGTVLANTPTLTTPVIGAATGTSLTLTGALQVAAGSSAALAIKNGSPDPGIYWTGGGLVIGNAVVNTILSVANTAILMGTKITQYNAINTVGNGVPSELATVDSTGLTANVAATTAYAVPAASAGLYRISVSVELTTAASISSTLPNVQIKFTSADSSTVITIDATPVLGAAGIGQTGVLTGNAVGLTAVGVIVVNAKASTNIQYQTVNYASSLAGMAYALHIKIEAL